METNKILQADVLDLLFENRNKSYGAYELRKTYNKRIGFALLVILMLVLVSFITPFFFKTETIILSKQEGTVVTLDDYKPKEVQKEMPIPAPKIKSPHVESTKFTKIKIVKDNILKPDELLPDVSQLDQTKIDVISQKGAPDDGLAAPMPVDNNKGVVAIPEEEPPIADVVEVEASFPGGESAWHNYLQRNLNASAPVEGGAPEGSYTVVVQFIVDKEGNISDVKALTSHGYGMEEEAVRAIKRGPKWVPAIQNGRNVKAYRKQPVTFVVAVQ